jgi:hypothetical protein
LVCELGASIVVRHDVLILGRLFGMFPCILGFKYETNSTRPSPPGRALVYLT